MAASARNEKFRAARLRLQSPSRPGFPMSRQELADLVNSIMNPAESRDQPVTVNHICKIEQGINTWPRPHRRAAYRTALKVDDDADIGFFSRRRRPADERPIADGQQTELLRSNPQPHPIAAGVRRRTLLRTGGLAALAPACANDEDLAHFAAASEDAHRYLDGQVLAQLEVRLSECADIDGTQGPDAAIPGTLAIIETVEEHIRSVKPHVRIGLLSLGARAAELAGWLHRDAGATKPAETWRDRATAWALEAGDYAMAAYVLVKKSQAAWDHRDAPRMLGLAQAVQHGPWSLPPRIRAEVAQQEARGHAMMEGRMTAADGLLAQARSHLAEEAAQPDGIATHYGQALFSVQTAICYGEAGLTERAVELFGAALQPTLFSLRDYGYFLSLMAQTVAATRQPDQAAIAGTTALAIAKSAGSNRTVAELLRLAQQLRPWSDRPSVRHFHKLLPG